jgi:hypothetical protein
MAAPTNIQSAEFCVPVTLGATALADGECRCIVAEVAGRVNITQGGVERANYPLVAGYNPVRATIINNPTSGTAATGVWALY